MYSAVLPSSLNTHLLFLLGVTWRGYVREWRCVFFLLTYTAIWCYSAIYWPDNRHSRFGWLLLTQKWIQTHDSVYHACLFWQQQRASMTTVPISVTTHQNTWQFQRMLAPCHVAHLHRKSLTVGIVVILRRCDTHQYGHCEARVMQRYHCIII